MRVKGVLFCSGARRHGRESGIGSDQKGLDWNWTCGFPCATSGIQARATVALNPRNDPSLEPGLGRWGVWVPGCGLWVS
ncbi:hypothetical protein VTK26DRAFT_3224 [Humicola hyalothermophila]